MLTDGTIVTLDIRDAERLQGLAPNWTTGPEINSRNSNGKFNERKRWVLVGNAINVRVAEWLGNRLANPVTYHGPAGKPLPRGARFPIAASWDGKFRLSYDFRTWPVAEESQDLEEFLEFEPRPLSYRATLGFYSRAKKSRLRFTHGFLNEVSRHLKRMAP